MRQPQRLDAAAWSAPESALVRVPNDAAAILPGETEIPELFFGIVSPVRLAVHRSFRYRQHQEAVETTDHLLVPVPCSAPTRQRTLRAPEKAPNVAVITAEIIPVCRRRHRDRSFVTRNPAVSISHRAKFVHFSFDEAEPRG